MRSPEYNFLTSRNIIVGPKDQGEFYVGYYVYTRYGQDTVLNDIPASFELNKLFPQSEEELFNPEELPDCRDVFVADTSSHDTIYISNCRADLKSNKYENRLELSNNGSLFIIRDAHIFDLKIDSGSLFIYGTKYLGVDKLKIDKSAYLFVDDHFTLNVIDLSGYGDIIKTHEGVLDIKMINKSAKSFFGKYIVSSGILQLNTENCIGQKGVEVRKGASLVNNADNKTDQLVVSEYGSVVLNEDLYVNYVNIKTKDNKERHLSAGIYSQDDFDWLKGSKILHVLKGVVQTEQDVVFEPTVKMSFEDSVISAFHRIDLNRLKHSSSQICRFNTCTNGLISNDVNRLMVVYYPKTEKVYIEPVPYGGYSKYIIPDDPSHEIITVSYDDQIHYTQFILVMILTVLIESLVFWIFYRNKRDIRIVAITNVFTNLLMNFLILGIVNARPGTYAGVGNAFLLIVLEPLVWIFESILYSRKLSKTCEHYKLKAWGIAFLANVASLMTSFPLSDYIKSFSISIWGF
jgi:hypothetical protein